MYILTEKYTHKHTRGKYFHTSLYRCRGFVNDFFPPSLVDVFDVYTHTHTHTPTQYKTHVYTHRGTLTSRQTETAGVGVGSTENEGDRDVCKRWHGGNRGRGWRVAAVLNDGGEGCMRTYMPTTRALLATDG